MKVTFVKSLLGVSLALAGLAASAGTIVGSKHDFSTTMPVDTKGQICIACHAPHNPLAGGAGALWNHTLSAVASYTLYTSTTMNSTTAQPGATSKLCLSCHDGTVAVNSFGGVAAPSGFIAASANLGTTLANDHPIGMTYDAALVTADGALRPITTANTIGSGTKTKTGTIASNMLYGGVMECASCHDVHNTFTADLGSKLIKVTMAASALCTTCHDK